MGPGQAAVAAAAPPPAAPAADISRIAGNYSTSGDPFLGIGVDQSGVNVLVIITQGNQFNGTATAAFDGTTLTLTAQATSGCPGTFTVTATVDTAKNTMTGTISGSDCHITFNSLAFTAKR